VVSGSANDVAGGLSVAVAVFLWKQQV